MNVAVAHHSSLTMRPSVPDVHITDSQDAEFAAYRALASQAVVGLLFGLLAPTALLAPAIWGVPAAGVFFSAWALRRIKSDPLALTGRKMAWAGLSLSLLLLVAAPSDWLVYRHIVRDEARQISSLWLRCVTHKEPQKAHQLTVPPRNRQPLDDSLWRYYRNNPHSRRKLEGYVQMPLVRTLLEMGSRADVRFYETAGQSQEDDADFVEQVYAVTYEEAGEKKTFFVVVQSMRTKLADGQAGWQILQTALAGKPEEK
jgi:hypothetical protein